MLQADVTDQESIDAAVGQVIQRFGQLDLVINKPASARSARWRTTATRSGIACSTSTCWASSGRPVRCSLT